MSRRVFRRRLFRRRLFRLRRRDRKFVLSAVAVGVCVALIAAHSHVKGTTAGGHGHGSGHVGNVAVTSGSEATFFKGVLADLGAPANRANIGSLEAWYPHEYPSWPPGAAYNPLDTTLTEPGSWAFNSFSCGAGVCHVQSYPSATEGAQATATTLAAGYPRIVAALRSGAGLCGNASVAGEFSTWSGGGYTGVC